MQQKIKIHLGRWCLAILAMLMVSLDVDTAAWAKTTAQTQGKLRILRWQEKIYLGSNSRRNVINFRGRGENIGYNSYIKNWSYIIGDERIQKGTAKFTVEYARLNGKPAEYFNTETGIVLDVGEVINGKEVNVEFAYSLTGTQDKPFYRVEPVFFGGMLNDAEVNYTVTLQDGMMLCSVPKYLHYTAPFTYGWNGKITAEMPTQMLHVTQPTGTWKISAGIHINDLQPPISLFGIKTPKILNEGNQVILQHRIVPSVQPASFTSDADYYELKFKALQANKLDLVIESTITNTRHAVPNKNYAPTQFTKISSADRLLLDAAVNEIKILQQRHTQNGASFNLFTTIGEWVHDYITYDEALVDTNTDLKSIVTSRRGVCEHYAILFTAICRAMGLPAFTVSGSAFDEEHKKFVGHAWNFVYSNGRWYEVDPTWNLMSGVVPISHIIFQRSSNKTSHFVSTSQDPYKVDLARDIEYIGK